MVDYAPPWDPLPRDSIQQPHNDMSLAQVRKHAVELANLLDENKEEQVLKEACLGLCQLFGEGIQNDRIQVILEANVVPKLVALLKPSKSRTVPISVQSAALQVLGNVACGDDRQTQVVIDSDALPCLRALLSSSDHRIRKEVCWIVSNITESSHQVQDVLDADILPPLLKLLDNQDAACREDATWVLFNLSSNRDPAQIAYLAEKNGVRALCNLLACTKELDVMWKGCGTVAAVALKGLRNILISGQTAASSDPDGYNKMASLVAEAHGVERIEALTTHSAIEVRTRARLLLERMFGAERTTVDISPPMHAPAAVSGISTLSSPPPPPPFSNASCSCAYQQHQQSQQHHHHAHASAHAAAADAAAQYQANGLYDININLSAHAALNSASHMAHATEHGLSSHLQTDGEIIDVPGSSSGSSTDSDPDEDDSDLDLIPPPPAPCNCVLCTDESPLAERRPRGKGSSDDPDSSRRAYTEDGRSSEIRPICDFCSGGGRLGDGRAGLAAKLGRAVRLGHPHCMAVLLSRMSWSQRVAATEAPALLHPGGGPPDGGVGNSLPAVVLAAQLGKPDCLALLLRRCRPDLDLTHGKKRLTALAWAAHKSYMRCCQLLIEFGANPATKCGDAVTALHLAASGGGHVAICKLLIDHDAPVNAKSAKKQTPLCLAAQKGFVKVVQLLLEHGADPNNEDEGKYTPLHLSASNGFVSCVDLLLKAGARVDATTRKGVTPLHYAVQSGHDAVMKLLIAAGAKVNCNRKPLLLIAADDGKPEVVRILLDARAQVDCKANIKAMLDKDSEVFDYLTPLHLAASRAHQPVVELLLRNGANVNEVTTKSGWCALDFAVLNGNAECAVTLLEHGATVTDKCKVLGRHNWTLVQYAAHHGAKEVVRLLIQRLKEQRVSMADSKNVSGKPNTGPFAPNAVMEGQESVDLEEANGMEKTANGVEESATHLDYIGDDDHDNDSYQPEEESVTTQPSHRYDPRSTEGDESGFGTGPGYGNATVPVETSKSQNRRRVVKEERPNNIRARELKKRESEANEARDRLEEAINQRSVSKLTEAIAHVSKLVLHLATTVTSEGTTTTTHVEHNDINGYAEQFTHSAHTQPVTTQSKQTSSPSNAYSTPAPLATEVGLGNEVQRARKILAGLLAEEKRQREVKEKEVADSKRENAQQTVKKAISAALEGGDPRTLSRAVTRTTRAILEKEDPTILEANENVNLISELEKCHGEMKSAMSAQRLDSLSEALPKVKVCISNLENRGGTGAITRAFGGASYASVVHEAGNILKELREKRERDIAEEAQARNNEKEALSSLETAMQSNDIVSLEGALSQASKALLSKESDLAGAIESAKKVLSKWVKGERRKLRQANNTNDPDTIEKAAEEASKFGLQALQSDINSAKALAQKLREQAELKAKLEVAIEKGEMNSLSNLRPKLNALGMFSEAEDARAEYERLQKALRAQKLLESAIEEAKQCRDPISEAFKVSKSASEILDMVSDWSWPDAQKLYDLSERTRKHGASSHSLCETAGALAKDLAKLGRQILELTSKSNDARAIAALVAGYEKSFVSVSKPEAFDKDASEKSISEAKRRLAIVQANDQESVKAESAQVKVEYALATSRRSAARNRHGRGNQGRYSAFSNVGSNTSGATLSGANSNIANANGDAPVSSPRVNKPNGIGNPEARSQSSLSSDFGDDDGSETEVGLDQGGNDAYAGRHSDTSRVQVAKKMRGGGSNLVMDDSGVRTPTTEDVMGDGSNALTGDCSHFYSYKEGSMVLCVRCGHHRSSSNPDWLARVKRRTGKMPAEMAAPMFLQDGTGAGPGNDILSYGGAGMESGMGRNMNEMPMRSMRTSGGLMNHHGGVPQGAYGMNSMGGLNDMNHIGDGGGGGGGGFGVNMPMMVPMVHSATTSANKMNGGGGSHATRGRRPHVGLTSGSGGYDTHLHGMSNMYEANAGTGGMGVGGSGGGAGMYGVDMSPTGTAMHGYGGVSDMSGGAGVGVNVRGGGGIGGGIGGAGHSSVGMGMGIGAGSGAGGRVSSTAAGSATGHALGVDPHMLGAGPPLSGAEHGVGVGVGVGMGVGAMEDSGMDLGTDFAKENFGFDIDAIVNDNPPSSDAFYQR